MINAIAGAIYIAYSTQKKLSPRAVVGGGVCKNEINIAKAFRFFGQVPIRK
jgi:hypothetical protein